MSKVLEKNVAEIIVITILIVALFGMSSCGTSYNTCAAYQGWNTGCGRQYHIYKLNTTIVG